MAELSRTGGVIDTNASGTPQVSGSYFSDVMALAEIDMPFQDDAASTTIVNNAGTNGSLVGGGNTETYSVSTGLTWPAKALHMGNNGRSATLPGGTYARNTAGMAAAVIFKRTSQPTVNNYIYLMEGGTGGTRLSLYMGPGASPDIIVRSKSADAETVSTTTSATDAANQTWYTAITSVDVAGEDITLWLNGTSESLTPSYTQGTTSDTDSTGIDFALPFNAGRQIAFFAAWGQELTNDDAQAITAGPEPTISSVTLDSEGAIVDDADANSNGSLTRTILHQVSSDGGTTWSQVAEQAAGPVTLASGLNRVWVIPENNGGIADPVVSNTVLVTGAELSITDGEVDLDEHGAPIISGDVEEGFFASNLSLQIGTGALTASYTASDTDQGDITKNYLFQKYVNGTWENRQYGSSNELSSPSKGVYRVWAIAENDLGVTDPIASSRVAYSLTYFVAQKDAVPSASHVYVSDLVSTHEHVGAMIPPVDLSRYRRRFNHRTY